MSRSVTDNNTSNDLGASDSNQNLSGVTDATPQKQLQTPTVVSSPTSALRQSTRISKNGLSEITLMIQASWVLALLPVSHFRSKVVPTICDVNHNDPDSDRLMKMTHTICGGYLIPDGLGVHSGGEIGNDMIFLLTPYGEVCVCVYYSITKSSLKYSHLTVCFTERRR